MSHSPRPIVLWLLLEAVWFAGCRASGSVFPLRGAEASAPQAGTNAPKRLPRDSFLAEYRNSDYGISFRYPRNFALLEQSEQSQADDDGRDSGASDTQQDLAATTPGSVLIATVSIPDDAYPNTAFRRGTLQFLVNPGVTPEACRAFAAPDSDEYGTTGTISVRGIHFDWHNRGSAAPGNGDENREYAGFSGGVCYEFRIELLVSDSIEPDSRLKPADLPKIMGILEKVVSSFYVYAKPVPAASRNSKPG